MEDVEEEEGAEVDVVEEVPNSLLSIQNGRGEALGLCGLVSLSSSGDPTRRGGMGGSSGCVGNWRRVFLRGNGGGAGRGDAVPVAIVSYRIVSFLLLSSLAAAGCDGCAVAEAAISTSTLVVALGVVEQRLVECWAGQGGRWRAGWHLYSVGGGSHRKRRGHKQTDRTAASFEGPHQICCLVSVQIVLLPAHGELLPFPA